MSDPAKSEPEWSIQAARTLYNIDRWGAKYFDINDAGNVIARPLQDAGSSVEIEDIIEEAKARGLKFPLLIRFQDILRHRVEAINKAFRGSIAEYNYQGKYRGVFPIKVNQLREVVEEILDAGKPYNFGLEVGSKPELFAGLALQNQLGDLIICNGYKDTGFIRMAMMGLKLGKKVILVVEKLEELKHVIAVSRQAGVEPLIGIRARLSAKGAGKWAESGGENAKFGLSTAELIAATELLKAENRIRAMGKLMMPNNMSCCRRLSILKPTEPVKGMLADRFSLGGSGRHNPTMRSRAGGWVQSPNACSARVHTSRSRARSCRLRTRSSPMSR